jgi:hypothetical protein
MKDMIIQDSKWFDIDVNEASKAFKLAYKDYSRFIPLARKQSKLTNKMYTIEKMEEKLKEYLDQYVPNIPVQHQFVAPAIKEIKLPKRTKK